MRKVRCVTAESLQTRRFADNVLRLLRLAVLNDVAPGLVNREAADRAFDGDLHVLDQVARHGPSCARATRWYR